MRVYLDTCAIQRPLDDKRNLRIVNESEAVLNIIAAIQDGKHELVVSSVLLYETNAIVSMARKQYLQAVLDLRSLNIEISSHVKKRAEYFTLFGIKAMDALHLASAESAYCDFFCTCDDRFLKRAREIMDLQFVVVSPMTLAKELKL